MKRCVIMFSSHWRTSIDPLTFKWTVALQRFLQRRFKRRLEDFYKPSASADRLSIPPSSLCQNDGLYRFDSETLHCSPPALRRRGYEPGIRFISHDSSGRFSAPETDSVPAVATVKGKLLT